MTRTLPPIRRQLVVPGPTELAFTVFTDELGAWWPLGGFSVFGAEADVRLRDGQIIESGPDGQEAVWGTILHWDPPAGLRFTWHPGQSADVSTEVSVSFVEVVGGQTLVTLEHVGWERLADPAAGRRNYSNGWPAVLAQFGARAEKSPVDSEAGEGEVWLALLHTPGPDVENVFAHPDFREHLAFLGRLDAAGLLVAAGSFGDEATEGMTVVRLPGPAHLAEVVRQAHDEDLSVARGLFVVRVRPWRVALVGGSAKDVS